MTHPLLAALLAAILALLIWQAVTVGAPSTHLLTARVVSQDHYAEWKAVHGFALLPCDRTAHIPDDRSGAATVAFINCLYPVDLD